MTPPHLHDGFGSLVAQVFRQWRRAVDRRMQPFGLTEATWLPLIHLSRTAAPMRQKDLAASLVLDGSSVVRLLDALETAGLIERHGETADRRAKIITLTGHARSIIDQVESASRTVRQRVLAGVSDDDLAIAARVLTQISQNLSAEQDKDL